MRGHDILCTAALAASLALGGCAKAISADGGDLGSGPDGGPGPGENADAATLSDAAPPDLGPVPVTLTHSASDAVEDQSSLRCNDNNNGTHAANSYYRVFDLEDMGVVGDLAVEKVSIGIQEADSAAGGPVPATVKLYTLEGDFILENLTEIATVPVEVPLQTLSVFEVPVTADVPANSVLVLEFFTARGENDYNLWLGANDDGQSAPSYTMAVECDYQQPINVAAIVVDNNNDGQPDFDTSAIHWVMSVSGTATP